MSGQQLELLKERLAQGFLSLGLTLSEQQQKQLLDYLILIAKWNKVYNLTAIRDPEEMLTHHLLDSLAVIAPLQKHLRDRGVEHGRVLDVGSGAGLPGVVIAVCCPDVWVCCVDAVGKKASFISQAATELGLKNLQAIHTRVEALAPTLVQEGFDLITSRAFASLGDFVTLTKPHLKCGTGVWMAMKAKDAEHEVMALPSDAGVFHVERLSVPFLNEERRLVWLRLH